jgi:hypothetical protein
MTFVLACSTSCTAQTLSSTPLLALLVLPLDAFALSHVHAPLLHMLSYGPPWAHYLGGYQDRVLGGPLGPGLRYTAPDGVEHKYYGGEVLG